MYKIEHKAYFILKIPIRHPAKRKSNFQRFADDSTFFYLCVARVITDSISFTIIASKAHSRNPTNVMRDTKLKTH